MNLFGKRDKASAARPTTERVARHSSGWEHLHKYMQTKESLRVLDIGPTSSTNINYITGLGHSIYMANLVEEANRPEWLKQEADGTMSPSFDVDGFLAQNLNFSGRSFNVVTLWDAVDYLPAILVPGIINRLYEVMDPAGQILAFFHAKSAEPDTAFMRYHLTGSDQIELQRVASLPMLQTYSNRQVETLFKQFATYKFYLAKDSLREVLITR